MPEYKRVGPWTPLWKYMELESYGQGVSAEGIAGWFVARIYLGVAEQLKEAGCQDLSGSHLVTLRGTADQYLPRLALFMMDYPATPALVDATVQNIRMRRWP